MKQENLASKSDIHDIADFVKKTDFDNKLLRFYKRINLNKTRDIEFKTKLDDLEKNVEIISTKGLTADLINKHSIFDGAKYFSINGLQNYLVFITFSKYAFILETSKNDNISSWKSIGMSEEKE